MISRPFFTPRKKRMRMNLDHVASGHFVLGRDVLCEFDYWPLAVCLQQKVCTQGKAAVPVRRIVSCPVYFRTLWSCFSIQTKESQDSYQGRCSNVDSKNFPMGILEHFKLCVSKAPDFSILGRAMEVYSRWAVIRWRHPNLVPCSGREESSNWC